MRAHVAWLGGLVCATTATQIANLNVSSSDAISHDCGETCQRRLEVTLPADVDAVGRDFDVEFFSTASNFSKSLAPGEVLKLQPLNPHNLTLDGGATSFRLQYTSVDLDGSLVPATGFIAFPFTPHISPDTESSNKYRLAAFAHGTVGIFQGCAPSNGPALYDYGSWQPVLEKGYAIVATDYAGLGNNYTSHKYLSFPAHVNDVYYSVVAARKLFGDVLTKEWVSFGHSQGGGAVWKLAESKFVAHDPSYLGTVAIAPATYFITQLVEASASNSSSATGVGFLPLLPESARRAIPSYNETILAPTLRKRTQLATQAQWCLEAIMGMTLDLKLDQIISNAGAVKDLPTLEKWQKMVAPAQGDKSPKPILIIQGQNDTAVSWKVTEEAWNASCHAGNELHLRLFPSQGHRPSLAAGGPAWLTWLDKRFETGGKRGCNVQCTKYTREPFNMAYVRAPSDIDLKPYLGPL